ncbi:cytochrome P450 [Streptomyces sp. NPDC056161]|uniref:cytochrome P450 n=1 Tax=Streptomyces sp. NPDC056161 TaxID=3345732 RepID=UPI0035DD3DF3
MRSRHRGAPGAASPDRRDHPRDCGTTARQAADKSGQRTSRGNDVTPSLDTTILAITNVVALFAENLDQWDLLRADRSLIPHAINESLRVECPVPQFSRVLTEDHEIDGVPSAVGSRVALLYGSANRDERQYPDPARFDITRRPSDHLAFGRGEHVCPGIHLARLEIGVLLERLADHVARFEIQESRPLLNKGLRGLEYLEAAIQPVTGTG